MGKLTADERKKLFTPPQKTDKEQRFFDEFCLRLGTTEDEYKRHGLDAGKMVCVFIDIIKDFRNRERERWILGKLANDLLFWELETWKDEYEPLANIELYIKMSRFVGRDTIDVAIFQAMKVLFTAYFLKNHRPPEHDDRFIFRDVSVPFEPDFDRDWSRDFVKHNEQTFIEIYDNSQLNGAVSLFDFLSALIEADFWEISQKDKANKVNFLISLMKMCPKWRIHATWSIGKTPQTSSRAIKSLNKAYMKKLMEIAVKLKVDM